MRYTENVTAEDRELHRQHTKEAKKKRTFKSFSPTQIKSIIILLRRSSNFKDNPRENF